jgi:hypothetical protein
MRKTMNTRHRSRLVPALALFAVAGLAACDNPVEADEHGEPVAAQLLDRDTGVMLAETHGSGSGIHWDGGIPHLHPGEGIELDVIFLDENGNEIPLGGEFTVGVELASGAPTGIVSFELHGDHVDLEGVAVGTTSLVFSLNHGSHSDWDSPAIEVEVDDHG